MQAIYADTLFLADNHIMDYSLLVALDREKEEVVVGIIGRVTAEITCTVVAMRFVGMELLVMWVGVSKPWCGGCPNLFYKLIGLGCVHVCVCRTFVFKG